MISYRQWAAGELAEGQADGVRVETGALVIGRPTGSGSCADPSGSPGQRGCESARWTSPWVTSPEPFGRLVASWNARTPAGTWIEVGVEVESRDGAAGGGRRERFVLGRWAEQTHDVRRTSVAGQDGALARVEVDELVATTGRPLAAWRLTVTLTRSAGSAATPVVAMVGAMTSAAGPHASPPATARPGAAWGTVLDVPAYSQMLHRDDVPRYGHGGEGWCSPTSIAMVLAYWGRGPSESDYAAIDPSYPDRWVGHAAAGTFDHAYGGCGNWSFTTAYAGRFGLHAFVARLAALSEVERFIAAGIPLAASLTFAADELDGAGYATAGHLLVVVGFTSAGDVVCHDPASHLVASNDEVRTTYDRASFERAWLTGSGGVVYVVHPLQTPLPPRPAVGPPAW